MHSLFGGYGEHLLPTEFYVWGEIHQSYRCPPKTTALEMESAVGADTN